VHRWRCHDVTAYTAVIDARKDSGTVSNPAGQMVKMSSTSGANFRTPSECLASVLNKIGEGVGTIKVDYIKAKTRNQSDVCGRKLSPPLLNTVNVGTRIMQTMWNEAAERSFPPWFEGENGPAAPCIRHRSGA
jgi:hypothetical protein